MSTTPSSASPFLGDRPRTGSINLDWPVEFDGKAYRAIQLRRMTAGEVAAFAERARAQVAADPDANPRAPIFLSETGEPIPDGLFDVIDDDDALRLDEAAADFLPRRFQAARSATDSIPADGSDTEQTS